MSVKDRITATLEQALAPDFLAVHDESHQHAGHGGWREGGETHFRVEIVAGAFNGKSRVERHRMINALLADELADRVHALALSTRTPDEAAALRAAPAGRA
jgi:BolA protein